MKNGKTPFSFQPSLLLKKPAGLCVAVAGLNSEFNPEGKTMRIKGKGQSVTG